MHRKNSAEHLLAYLMGEVAYKHEMSARSSCERMLTYETIPVSVHGP